VLLEVALLKEFIAFDKCFGNQMTLLVVRSIISFGEYILFQYNGI